MHDREVQNTFNIFSSRLLTINAEDGMIYTVKEYAAVMKSVNIADLKSAAEKLTGSNPVRRTSASAQHLLSSGLKILRLWRSSRITYLFQIRDRHKLVVQCC